MSLGKPMHGRIPGWSLRTILPGLASSYDFSQLTNTHDRCLGIQAMQTLIAASVATKIQECPAWLKSTARFTFAFLVVKGSIALATAWLALRGFEGL
jgi:hypothetical protein